MYKYNNDVTEVRPWDPPYYTSFYKFVLISADWAIPRSIYSFEVIDEV